MMMIKTLLKLMVIMPTVSESPFSSFTLFLFD